MICNVCNIQESKLHITEIDKLSKKILVLDICVECAVRTGLLPAHGHVTVNGLIKTKISDLLKAQQETADETDIAESLPLSESDLEVRSATAAKRCPTCGISIDEIKASGRFGCDADYEVFRDEVEPILARLHPHTRHVGKVPKNLPDMRQRQAELTRLKSELQDAIVLENYEEAATLRDRIKQLQGDWPTQK